MTLFQEIAIIVAVGIVIAGIIEIATQLQQIKTTLDKIYDKLK